MFAYHGVAFAPVIPREFLALFRDPAPGLVLEACQEAGLPEHGIAVEHRLHRRPSKTALARLSALGEGGGVPELREFYSKHDGAELCIRRRPQLEAGEPLVRLEPIESWAELTATYQPGGEYDWTIDHNAYRKTGALYRGSDPWIVFGRIEHGPACLTTFLRGPNEGRIYYLAPEPGFDIVRPVAKSFLALLARMGADLAGFLHLCQATVAVPPRAEDDFPYGLAVLQYVPDRH